MDNKGQNVGLAVQFETQNKGIGLRLQKGLRMECCLT